MGILKNEIKTLVVLDKIEKQDRVIVSMVSHGTCSYICMYIGAAANSAMLQL